MTNQYVWDRITGRDPDLRAADADRESTAERLRTSHTEGRLDLDEFQQRVERCYEAKTLGDLDELVRDLPRQDGDPGQRYPSRRSRPVRGRLAPLAPILIVLIVVSAAAGHPVFFGLWLPLAFLFWRMSWWRVSPRPTGTRPRWTRSIDRGVAPR